jgi:predicted regulator of Ras-like GTPase activity (Roadblock/LC7/MglB family)
MSEIAEDIRTKMMNILKEEEVKTNLGNLAVLSRIGMKVASANSSELDADAVSASSTALIDLGLRLSEATNHGALMEILLHNNSGYSILMAINDEYMIFGGLKEIYRIGYYLGYLRELAKKLNILISGGEISEMALKLQAEELTKLKVQEEKEEIIANKVIMPSIEQDKKAMNELLGFLDNWDKEEKEAMGVEDFEDLETTNIVTIPDAILSGLPKISDSVPKEEPKEIKHAIIAKVKVYEDEVPPVPLDDYTPIDVEDQSTLQSKTQVIETENVPKSSISKEITTPEELPPFEQLVPPDFDSGALEYDTEFVLEEESEALDSVLKDLGWEEED